MKECWRESPDSRQGIVLIHSVHAKIGYTAILYGNSFVYPVRCRFQGMLDSMSHRSKRSLACAKRSADNRLFGIRSWGGRRNLLFECLEVRLQLAADFGDAPSPYSTLLVDDGPRHVEIGPRLGQSSDADGDGSPTLGADGDASDDGVVFNPLRIGQLGASVVVSVQNAPTGARLDAWVDFDGDGSWGGSEEQIAESVLVINGAATISFDVPSSLTPGEKYARFRISEAGGLGPNGPAPNGEVEDYRVNIAPSASATGSFIAATIIDEQASSDNLDLNGMTSVDMDRDGDLDFVAYGTINTWDYALFWYENDGAESFTRRMIGSNLISFVVNVSPDDLDGDGDIDLLTGLGLGFGWYENDGSQGFTFQQIATGVSGIRAATTADLDADGDLDIVASISQFYGGPYMPVVWYENDGQGTFIPRAISPQGLEDILQPIDFDRDGD